MDKDICCNKFDTAIWDEKKITWKDKLFLEDEVVQFMHIPLNMGKVVSRMMNKIEEADAMVDAKDFLMLCYDPSPWKSQIYMTVSKNIPNGKMAQLSGEFLSKVYDGPYNAVPKWIKDMEEYVSKKGGSIKKFYFHYAYCPKCAKKYGHNYAVAFAQVK